ncbi:MAG: hypothetical protein K0B15_00675 [Lentimicrobium sp.]|nr:hypothetical protein [Lentimicrobium sp.]
MLNSNKVLRKSGVAGQCQAYAGIYAYREATALGNSCPETALQKRK